MGVSVREKIKGSNDWWIFVRHAGERTAQHIGRKEDAELVKLEIEKEIRTARFSIRAMKAARAPEKKESAAPTLKEYFEKHFAKEYLKTGVRGSTREAYEGAFDRHILPVLGDKPLDEITRKDVKADLRHS